MMALYTCDLHQQCRLLADTLAFEYGIHTIRVAILPLSRICRIYYLLRSYPWPQSFMWNACVFPSDGRTSMLESNSYLTAFIDYVTKVNTG